jgi:hypothetical protein
MYPFSGAWWELQAAFMEGEAEIQIEMLCNGYIIM